MSPRPPPFHLKCRPTRISRFSLYLLSLMTHWPSDCATCIRVGIRSKMALCSSGSAQIVLFRVSAYPSPARTPVFLIIDVINGLGSRRSGSLTHFFTSRVAGLRAGGGLRAAAAEQRKRSIFIFLFFKRIQTQRGCGWKDALNSDLRGFSHRKKCLKLGVGTKFKNLKAT